MLSLSLPELREEVWRANQSIVRAGLVTLSFGNASGVDRDAGVLVIKHSGVPYDELRPEHLVVVALENGGVVEGELRPSSDTPTRLALYRRFLEIGGVVHTHSTAATAWAQAGRSIPPLGTTHAGHFHGAVPVTWRRWRLRRSLSARMRARWRTTSWSAISGASTARTPLRTELTLS